MQEPGEKTEVQDTDADPEMLNPRDLRDEESGDGARDDEDVADQDPDGDPGSLNPRDDQL